LADLDKRREQAEKSESDRAKQQEERLRGVLAQQVPALGKAMAVDKLVLTVDRQNATLSRIERAIERFRHLRVGGMLFLMFISAALAAGGVIASFWQDYHDGQNDRHFFTRLSRAGVELSIRRTADGSSVFVVQSSRLQRGTAWLKDDRGYIAGANFAIDEGGQ
jgi:hypothetical protein